MTAPPLPDIQLFDGTSGWAPFVEHCVRRALHCGEVLIAPGSLDRVLFVVLEGTLSVHVDSVDNEAVAVVRAGEHCGEVSLVDGLPRSAWVVAAEPSFVMAIPELLFWDLLTRWPQVAINVLRAMAGSVRGGNAEVSESRRLQAEYRRHASFDPLTGLYNRRWLGDVLPRQVARSRGGGEPLSVVMVDVDHFKRFNDTYGHAAGDYVLFAVGKRLQRSFRPTDLVARYGGEEFTVVLPQTGALDACRAAERVRKALASEPLALECGTVVQVSASFGVAELCGDQSAHELLKAADRGLYEAKGAGRNRVSLGEAAEAQDATLF